MTLPVDELVAARVEEIDKLIADLQKRRHELLKSGEVSVPAHAVPRKEAPAEAKKEIPASAPAKLERQSRPVKLTNPLERILDELTWKSFKKKEGEWAFLRDREGRLIDELDSEREFVDRVRKEGGVVVGKYRYQISEDKFLNRYFAGA